MSTTTETKSSKSNSAKTNKPKLSALQSSIVKSLQTLIQSIKNAEVDGKTFTPSDAVAMLRKGGFISQANIIESTERAAFDKEHGDSESQAKAALWEILNSSIGDIYSEHGLSKTGKGSSTRKERVSLTDSQKEEVKQIRRAYIAEKEKDESDRDQSVITAGQLGQIASRFNVSVPTVSKLLDDAGLTNKRTTENA